MKICEYCDVANLRQTGATTVNVVRCLRQAYQRTEDAAARVRDRLACRRRGHLWDTDRPAGPIHKRDICWRCNAVREEKR